MHKPLNVLRIPYTSYIHIPYIHVYVYICIRTYVYSKYRSIVNITSRPNIALYQRHPSHLLH